MPVGKDSEQQRHRITLLSVYVVPRVRWPDPNSAISGACADPVAEHYLMSQVKYANGVSSPHIGPCDSAYDRDRDSFLKHDSHGPSGLERASSAHDEVLAHKTSAASQLVAL